MPRFIVRAARAATRVALLAVPAACSGAAGPPDRRPDVVPAPEAPPPAAQRQRLRSNHEMLELAEQIPGFGGLYLSYPGIPAGERRSCTAGRACHPHGGSPIAIHVYLTAAGDSAHARHVLTRRFEAQGRSVAEVRIVPALYTFDQLQRWLGQIVPAVSNLGLSFFSASGGRNQVWVGFDTEAGALRARDVIRALGIPLDAVLIDIISVARPQGR